MVNLYRMRQLMNRKTVSILWQIEQEQAKATKVTTVITGMPRGGGQHDQVSSGAIKLAELKEVYSELITELETMRNELAPLIDTLDNIELRAAMRLRYLKGYKPEQIAQIFSALQTELNSARNRFYQREVRRNRFSLSEPSPEPLSEEHKPCFEIILPDGTLLKAVGFEEDIYPGVCVYARRPGKPNEIVSLIEYNPERNEGHRLCIGAYQRHLDEPNYYEPYVAERKEHAQSDAPPYPAH